MGCGCGQSSTTEYVFTAPNGQTKVYSKEIEAQVAKIRAGGGTITTRQK